MLREDFGEVELDDLLDESIEWFIRRAPPADQGTFFQLRQNHLNAITSIARGSSRSGNQTIQSRTTVSAHSTPGLDASIYASIAPTRSTKLAARHARRLGGDPPE
jgi:hypothetical protein